MHRHFREGKISAQLLDLAYRQFEHDQRDEMLEWLTLTSSVVESVHNTFLNLPSTVYLRTGDAIHLATAAEAGCKEIYSNDRHLLAAASLFKLKGINPLAK